MIQGNEPEFIARYSKGDLRPQCLWSHLDSVAGRMKLSAGKVGLGATGEVLGLVHDLGKATLGFKNYLKRAVGLVRCHDDSVEGKMDHSTAGAQVLFEGLSDAVEGRATLAADMLSFIVAAHHGFIDILAPAGRDALGKRLAKGESKTRKTKALSSLPSHIAARLEKLLCSDVEGEINRCLARAIAKEYATEDRHFIAGLLVRFLLSCLIDADRTDAADFESPVRASNRQHGIYLGWEELAARLEKRLDRFVIETEMDRLRQEVSDKCLAMALKTPGFFRLSVPTSGGKTFASLRFALNHAKENGMDRVIYFAPYTSIIDQSARNIRGALNVDFSDSHIILEHHSNLIRDDKNKTEAEGETQSHTERYELLVENWDSPIILTTMVQFLESIYGGANSCRRMHQLANSVLIFDEVQALPINMVHLFNLAVKFLVNACGATVLLCTATQPILHDIEPPSRALPFDAGRQVTVAEKQKCEALSRVDVIDYVRPQGWSTQRIAELALQESNLTKSVLVIVNTKRDARNIYQALRHKANTTPLYHLSTNMCSAHRMDKLHCVTKLLDGQRPLILVSTQLIEAGIDVDFDVVIRSLAGLDSIAQAAGRCNRHGKKPYKGRVILVNSNEEDLGRLPDIAAGKDSARRILEEFKRDKNNYFKGNLLGEQALERYFRYYFFDRSFYMDYPLPSESLVGRRDTLVSLLSSNGKSVQAYRTMHENRLPQRVLRQSFRTAAAAFEVIPSLGQGILVPYAGGKDAIADLASSVKVKQQVGILRKAQRFSVNCYSHELEALRNQGALYEVQKGILCLKESFYHDELGWSLSN